MLVDAILLFIIYMLGTLGSHLFDAAVASRQAFLADFYLQLWLSAIKVVGLNKQTIDRLFPRFIHSLGSLSIADSYRWENGE